MADNVDVRSPAKLDAIETAHDIFISYSRKDTLFATALHKALQKYTPPRGLNAPRRRLNVFRDTEDLTGTEYYASIDRHLRGSRRLLVICSPHAHRSKFVDDEIRRFAESHTGADIVPVLIAGVPNHEATPATEAEMAFPPALYEMLKLPLASDYRGFDPAADRIGSSHWRGAWFKLLADIYGCSRAEIEERERRRRFRQRVAWSGASAAGLAVLGGLLYLAEVQRSSATSLQLANQSMALADSDPELGTVRALEALARAPTRAATTALRVNVAKLPMRQIKITEGSYDLSAPVGIAFAPDGKRMFIADRQPKARVVDVQTGRDEFEIVGGGPIIDGRWSPDGTLLAAITSDRKTFVHETVTGKRVATNDGELYWQQAQAASAVSATVLLDRSVQLVELDRSGNWKNLGEVRPAGYAGPRIKPYETSLHQLSPDRRRIATLAGQGERRDILVTDLDSGRLTRTQLRSPAPNGLAWSPQGQYLVANSLLGFVVVDNRSGQVLFVEDTGSDISVEDVSFSPDGKLLAATDRNGATWLWDIANKKKASQPLPGEADRAYKPTFSQDGGLLSVVYANGRARVFSVSGNPPGGLARLEDTWGEISSVSFSPDAKTTVAIYTRGTLAMWDNGSWFAERRLPIGYELSNPGGRRAAALEALKITKDGSVVGIQHGTNWRGWNTISGEQISNAGPDLGPFAGALVVETKKYSLAKHGKDVLISGSARAETLRLSHAGEVMSATFNVDGNCVLSASSFAAVASGGAPADSNVARLWDAETGTLLREWRFDSRQLGPLAAVFAGRRHALVLFEGDGFVLPTPLCGPEDALIQFAREQVASREAAMR